MFTRDDIRAEYERLRYQHGWSFMACPEERLRTASVAFVGINPGGGGEGDTYAYEQIWSCEGVADCGFDGPRMRPQIDAWQELLGRDWRDIFGAQFIPFRSPDMKRLGNREEAIGFARELWAGVLQLSPASLFVTMGKLPATQLADLIGARLVARCPTGWGRQLIDVYDSPDGRRIVAMPHPSRFPLFGRGEASELAEQCFKAAVGRGDDLAKACAAPPK